MTLTGTGDETLLTDCLLDECSFSGVFFDGDTSSDIAWALNLDDFNKLVFNSVERVELTTGLVVSLVVLVTSVELHPQLSLSSSILASAAKSAIQKQ